MNGFSMPEWTWEQLSARGWRKFWDVVSGREFFQATPPAGRVEVLFNPFTGLPNPTPCEELIARMFGDQGAYFADLKDGDGLDLTLGYNRGGGERHDHLYGDKDDAAKTTQVYAPVGGKVVPIAAGERHKGHKYVGWNPKSQTNYVMIQFKELGAYKNVTLAIFHLADFKMVPQKDGRTRIGTLGGEAEGGTFRFKSGKFGKHVHFELYDKLTNSLPAKGKNPFLNLEGICKTN